jgi:hypothetical protein
MEAHLAVLGIAGESALVIIAAALPPVCRIRANAGRAGISNYTITPM